MISFLLLLLLTNNTADSYFQKNNINTNFYISITYIDENIDFPYRLECDDLDKITSSERIIITDPLTKFKLIFLLNSLEQEKNNEALIDTRKRIDFIYNKRIVSQICIDMFYVKINNTLFSYSGGFRDLVESIINSPVMPDMPSHRARCSNDH